MDSLPPSSKTHNALMRGLFVLILNFTFLFYAQADEEKGGYKETRLESEYKLSVPDRQAAALWVYLTRTYGKDGIKKLGQPYTSEIAEETFVDTYFDDPDHTLLNNHSGLRYRMRFINNQLEKQVIQLKLSQNGESGLVREEVKFKFNKKPDEGAGFTDHPFLKLVRPKDRPSLDSALAPFGIKGEQLAAAVELTQLRKRVYIFENGEPFATLTHDLVSSEAPACSFTELEIELNEKRFTAASEAERQRMQAVVESIKKDILTAFPAVKQDQTPKYNKMYALREKQPHLQFSSTVAWGSMTLLLLMTGTYIVRRVRRYNRATTRYS